MTTKSWEIKDPSTRVRGFHRDDLDYNAIMIDIVAWLNAERPTEPGLDASPIVIEAITFHGHADTLTIKEAEDLLQRGIMPTDERDPKSFLVAYVHFTVVD